MNKNPSSIYTIRFSDCDLFGHLNNARYIDYFLNAREDHLKNDYELHLDKFYREGLGWLVGSHEIKYLRPAAYNETVSISTSLLKADESTLFVEMLMTNESGTYLKAALWTKFIHVDVKTGGKAVHPASFMEFARSIEVDSTNLFTDTNERLKLLLGSFKKAVS